MCDIVGRFGGNRKYVRFASPDRLTSNTKIPSWRVGEMVGIFLPDFPPSHLFSKLVIGTAATASFPIILIFSVPLKSKTRRVEYLNSIPIQASISSEILPIRKYFKFSGYQYLGFFGAHKQCIQEASLISYGHLVPKCPNGALNRD